jgi:DNA (cytosine-5)-methyltransferase 1
VIIVDSFAGGGGASLGIEMALGRSPDIAINHDAEAIALHRANHPQSRHYQEDVWRVDPLEATAGRPVSLMWLSPDCTHHSKARGGKPRKKKIRGLAWVAVRWASSVRPAVIVLENVEEFQTWGPLLPDGTPCPARRGATFRAFVRKLERLGYAVEHRELRACDFGAPTIRKRLFLIARCDGQPIVWPAPTHGKGRTQAWRTAAECIDWSIPCPSIFLTSAEAKAIGVRRPLADATLRRIARGLKRFVIDNPKPFIVPVSHGGDARNHSIDEPLRTITSSSRSTHALVTPYLAGVGGRAGQSSERPVHRPYHTTTSKADTVLVAPSLVSRYGEREGQEPRTRSVVDPMPTVVPTQNGASLVSAFLARHYGGHENDGAEMPAPIPTVTAKDHHALVASSLIKLKGTARHGQQLTLPLHTVQAGGNHYGEVRAFLMKYYGTEQAPRLTDPMHTVTSKDRLGLVTVHGEEYRIADIGMRMLAPRELYRAQGFPDSYRIDIEFNGKPMTKTAQVRMCGNSVCPPLAEAIVRANVGRERQEMAA